VIRERQRRERDDVEDTVTLFRILNKPNLSKPEDLNVKYECSNKASCDRLLAGVHYNPNQPKTNWTPG